MRCVDALSDHYTVLRLLTMLAMACSHVLPVSKFELSSQDRSQTLGCHNNLIGKQHVLPLKIAFAPTVRKFASMLREYSCQALI